MTVEEKTKINRWVFTTFTIMTLARRIIVLLVYFAISFPMFSQKQENVEPTPILKNKYSTNIGLNLFSFVNFDYERRLNTQLSLFTRVGYKHGKRVPSIFNLVSCGSVYLQESREKTGLISGAGITIRREGSSIREERLTIFAEYRNTKNDEVIEDGGCHGGSTEVVYNVHDFSAHELALFFTYNSGIPHNGGVNMYLSLGLGMAYAQRKFSIEGSYIQRSLAQG